MKKVHLLCSTNWNPKTAKSNLDPLQTMLGHLADQQINLTKLVLIQGTLAGDFQYCRQALEELERHNLNPAICTSQDDGRPEKIANEVSKAAEQAAEDQAELWVDLTPGPKQRAAVFFAASSAIVGVKIVYSEADKNGQYVVQSIPRLESYNEWMGRHGLRLRNYIEELKPLALRRGTAEASAIQAAVPDLLTARSAFGPLVLSVASALFPLAEDLAKKIVPNELFNLPSISNINWDATIKGAEKEWRASAARAGQMAWFLRNLFAHGDKSKDAAGNLVPRLLDIHDALALLDCLAYLSARLHPTAAIVQPANEQMFYVAVDGDDVGRRFEELLAACVTEADAEQLYAWSWKVQQSLADHLADLMDNYEGRFIARTGDGFLAAVPQRRYAELKTNFKPRLAKETVTAGIGPTIKEAYLALKLGKARNRGGGWFFSFQPLVEEMLWQAEL